MVSEHITFKTEDGLTLEGVIHVPEAAGDAAIAVCHPHPQYGGDMHNNVVDALVQAANENGIVALRFNFRGMGHSEGEYGGGIDERQDVLAAAKYLRERDGGRARVALAGYSFGAAVALSACDDDVAALVCVSTPTVAMEAPLQPGGVCPVLFVSGDRDEYSDPAALERIAGEMGGRASVVIMPGVDHFWWGSNERLSEEAGRFLAEHLG